MVVRTDTSEAVLMVLLWDRKALQKELDWVALTVVCSVCWRVFVEIGLSVKVLM